MAETASKPAAGVKNPVTLKYPVLNGTDEVTSVFVRRPKVKDIAAMDKSRDAADGDADLASAIALVSILSGLPEDVVNEFDMEDFQAVSEVATSFLPS